MTFVERMAMLKEPTWKDVQKVLLECTLERLGWNKTRTAQALGLSLRTVRIKCKEFKIERVK